MAETIVAGFIRTPEGRAAVDAAVEEVRRRGGRLVVVHSARGGPEDPESVAETTEALKQLEGELKEKGLDVAVRDYARGKEPAEDILQVAEQEKASLIVIGLRRRSPVGKILMGSNAQSVLLAAGCPVLAVKAASS